MTNFRVTGVAIRTTAFSVEVPLHADHAEAVNLGDDSVLSTIAAAAQLGSHDEFEVYDIQCADAARA